MSLAKAPPAARAVTNRLKMRGRTAVSCPASLIGVPSVRRCIRFDFCYCGGIKLFTTVYIFFSYEEECNMPDKVTLDVREMPPWERHPKIFDTFDNLEQGGEILLINDHDPRPLHYQFMMEREGTFEWSSEEKGPQEWMATIRKVA